MGVGDTLTELGTKITDLYREILTTSTRVELLQTSTDRTLTRVETLLDQFAAKVQFLHDEHVREKALLEAEIRTLQGRLDALSEHAIHAVAREAAREIIKGSVTPSSGTELLRGEDRISTRRKKITGA
jgi:hypothetical protein